MMNLAENRSDLLSLLAEDHQVVTAMIRRLEVLAEHPVERAALFAELEERWLAHADTEETLVLAPLAERPDSAEVVAAVRACHVAIERVLDRLGTLEDTGAWLDALALLDRLIAEHVTIAEERLFEHAGPALDPAARRALALTYHAALRDLAA